MCKFFAPPWDSFALCRLKSLIRTPIEVAVRLHFLAKLQCVRVAHAERTKRTETCRLAPLSPSIRDVFRSAALLEWRRSPMKRHRESGQALLFVVFSLEVLT